MNKKGPGHLGLTGGSDDEDDDFHKKAVPRKKTVVARDSDSDEEYKDLPNPEREIKGADIAAKYSAE